MKIIAKVVLLRGIVMCSMQQWVSKRSFSVLSNLTRAFWNVMTYGNSGSIPMKTLWKNKTELHDMGRMQTLCNEQVQKPYVKDWSITVKKVKSQNNQWKKMVEENQDELWRGNGRRGRKRVSEWNRV